jgi:hypothetical protein
MGINAPIKPEPGVMSTAYSSRLVHIRKLQVLVISDIALLAGLFGMFICASQNRNLETALCFYLSLALVGVMIWASFTVRGFVLYRVLNMLLAGSFLASAAAILWDFMG